MHAYIHTYKQKGENSGSCVLSIGHQVAVTALHQGWGVHWIERGGSLPSWERTRPLVADLEEPLGTHGAV